MIFQRKSGANIIVSKWNIEFESPPTRYSNGLTQLDSYLTEFCSRNSGFHSLIISTIDGKKGLSLFNQDGIIDINFSIERESEHLREQNIRSFFKGLEIAPSEDYLANNGGIPNSTRMLSYTLAEDEQQVIGITKEAVEKLCGVGSNEDLDIKLSPLKQ